MRGFCETRLIPHHIKIARRILLYHQIFRRTRLLLFKHSPYAMSVCLPNENYTVGWICALAPELAAASAMLDEIHDKPQRQHPSDKNNYCLGRIAEHNIVIACLPAGIYGTSSAAIVAQHMLSSFTSIRFGLISGIGGGVPS